MDINLKLHLVNILFNCTSFVFNGFNFQKKSIIYEIGVMIITKFETKFQIQEGIFLPRHEY